MSLAAGTESIALAGAYRRAADFFELTKPRVTLMVLVTTFVGYYLASTDLKRNVAQRPKRARGASRNERRFSSEKGAHGPDRKGSERALS